MTLIAAANLFLLMAPQNCWVLVQETVPSGRVGSVGGYVHFLSNLAGIIGPAPAGFIVKCGGGYGASFVLAGALANCRRHRGAAGDTCTADRRGICGAVPA